MIGVETSVANLATPTPKMSTQTFSGRGFPSKGASAAAGRGSRGRGKGSAPGIQIEAQPLEGRMRVSLIVGDPLFSEIVVRDSRVLIGGQKFPADLVALDIREFDVVLGMDWLSRHRATLYCCTKEVKLHRPGKLEVKFRGIRRELPSSMISAMAA